MQCRNCGTEIAERAIICFRCGHATTDPVRKAVPIRPRRSPLGPLVLIVMLAAAGLYLGVESRTAGNPEPFQLAAGLCAGAALAVLLLTVARRQ
jgi:hypothetical protein